MSYNEKPQKQKQNKKQSNIFKKADAYGILLFEQLGHESWIPILQRREPVQWPHSAAPSHDRAGQTHTELRSLQVSSVTDLQKLALTFWKNQIHVLLLLLLFCRCVFFFFFTLWEKKHLNRLWPSRAVPIASWNPFNKENVAMPARERWHIYRQNHSIPAQFLRDITIKAMQTNTRALKPSRQEIQNGSNLKITGRPYSSWMAAKIYR